MTQVIKFSPDLFDLVSAGVKTTTVREGVRDYTLGEVIFTTPDNERVLHAKIINLKLKRFHDLNDSDAHLEGYRDVAVLHTVLKGIYPKFRRLIPGEPTYVTIIGFQILK